jgi:hypothetical protein
MAIRPGFSARRIQECLIQASVARGWKVTARDDEKVLVLLDHHRWVANVAMLYTTKEIQFFSNSTRGGKSAVPKDYIDNLKEDIGTMLRGAAPH